MHARISARAHALDRVPIYTQTGEFEILYYDGELRIVKTQQGFYGVNVREADEKTLLGLNR